MPSLQSLQFATFQQQQHPSSWTKLMMTNGSHSHILTPTQQTHAHPHTHSFSLSHSLSSIRCTQTQSHTHSLLLTHGSHMISATQALTNRWDVLFTIWKQTGQNFLPDVCTHEEWLCAKRHKQAMATTRGFYSTELEVAYFILTLRPQVRFSVFPRIFLMMLLRTVDWILAS